MVGCHNYTITSQPTSQSHHSMNKFHNYSKKYITSCYVHPLFQLLAILSTARIQNIIQIFHDNRSKVRKNTSKAPWIISRKWPSHGAFKVKVKDLQTANMLFKISYHDSGVCHLQQIELRNKFSEILYFTQATSWSQLVVLKFWFRLVSYSSILPIYRLVQGANSASLLL